MFKRNDYATSENKDANWPVWRMLGNQPIILKAPFAIMDCTTRAISLSCYIPTDEREWRNLSITILQERTTKAVMLVAHTQPLDEEPVPIY